MDIAIPVVLNPFGSFHTVESYSDLWRQRVLSVLLTATSTRVMRPRFGCSLSKPLFENYEQAADQAKGIVSGAFRDLLPSLELQSVTATTRGDDTVVVDVWYALPNGQVDTIQVSTNTRKFGFGD